jgi:hypothetical protein
MLGFVVEIAISPGSGKLVEATNIVVNDGQERPVGVVKALFIMLL